MKKTQISFEFIVVFAFLLFVFMMLIAFFPMGLEKVDSTKDLAEKLVRDIKVKSITASLAKSDFESNIAIPKKIKNVDIQVEIFSDPDNMLRIKDKDKNELLAKAFLPKIDFVDVVNPNGLTLIIKKDSLGILSMTRK